MARTDQIDPTVQALLRETKAGLDEHSQRVKRFDKSYDVYRASEPRPRSLAPWQSKMRTPYAMQSLDTAMVNMFTGAPRCKVQARTPDYAEQAKRFQLGMDYFTREDNLVGKVPVTIQQGLIYGVTVVKTHWLYKEGYRIERDWGVDLLGNPVGAGKPTAQPVVLRDGPSAEPWDVYDVWWDPNGRDVDSCQYVILRSWLNKPQVMENACTVQQEHDPSQCNGMYHNVELLFETGTSKGRRNGITAQDRFLQGDKNLRRDTFEIWEVWRDDRVTVIGNQKILLRDSPNPHWHGKKPIAIASTRPDIFKLQGIPETELLDDLQQGAWTVENMRMDNLHLTVQRGLTYREGGVIDPNALELRPRFKWPVTDHDDVMFQTPQPLPPEAYRETQDLLARMQYVTGINQFVSGGDMQSVDQNTATGVSTLTEIASRLLRFKASQLHFGVWQRVFSQWGQDIKQFMDKPIWVRVVGQGGQVDFQQVTPQDVVGEYDFVLLDTEESLSRQQERGEALALLNAFAPLLPTGMVNLKPILEKVANAYGFDNPDELLNSPAPPQPPAAPGQQGPPQLGPQGNGGVVQMLNGNMAAQPTPPQMPVQAIRNGA